MGELSPHRHSKPVFGTVREQGLRLRIVVALAPTVALIVAVGFLNLGAALTSGGVLAVCMGINALGFGRWIQPTAAVHTTPTHRAIIKLSIGSALLAAVAAVVTQSATVGYVAFALALIAGFAGMWLVVGPRKRAGDSAESDGLIAKRWRRGHHS